MQTTDREAAKPRPTERALRLVSAAGDATAPSRPATEIAAALCAADSLRRKWIGGNGLAAKRAANLAARIADRAGAVIVHEPDTYRRSREAELAALNRLQEEVACDRVIGNGEETG